ncbi:MAG TPA: tetratricopeptide repeat protein [Thermodesulfobacteriota bacterium]|jgi:TolA-binding protein
MRTKDSFVPLFFTMLLGCAATTEQIKEIYQKQTKLEVETERLSQDIELLKSQINDIQEFNSKLKKRLDDLEKKQALLGSPSVKSPDALYRLAESYYKKGKFEESVIEFQRFIDTYPKDIRVPASYLKQGLSLINIGRENEAKFFLETLVDKFPESEEAKEAKAKLKEISNKSK